MEKLSSILLLSTLLLAPTYAQQELFQENQDEDELDRRRDYVEALETGFGRLDPRMLEPLDQYSRQLMASGRHGEAHRILDQMTQIIRVEEGLYSATQYPYLLRRIETYGNQGDWVQARELMEHIGQLIKRSDNLVDERLMSGLDTLADLHLWGVASDNPGRRRYHFRQAERLSDFAVRIVRVAWGETDRRLPGMHYKLLMQYHAQAATVDRGGGSAISLRRIGDSGMARSRREAMSVYYFSGLRRLNAIRAVYTGQEAPELEALALAEIYAGDWHVLFNRPEAAAQAYRYGNELLLRAGIEQDAINRFFAHPCLLPAPVFFDSWDEAQASLNKANGDAGPPATTADFTFRQWSSQFPHVRAPDADGEFVSGADKDYAMFSFSLVGLEEVSRWYRGRLKKSVSVPQDLRVMNRRFSEPVDWPELEDMVRDFRFRPKLIDGVPQNVNATLVYRLSAP